VSGPYPEEIAIALYDERKRNDVWAIRQLFAPDAVLEFPGAAALGRVAGDPHALATFFEQLVATWRWVRQDIHDIVASGARLAVRYTVTVEYVPSGALIDIDVADFFEFRDGLITRLTEFVDTAALERVVAASAEPRRLAG
jgi:ketosteroid isomerase-like protein